MNRIVISVVVTGILVNITAVIIGRLSTIHKHQVIHATFEDEKAYGKGDKLWVHSSSPPIVMEVTPPSLTPQAEAKPIQRAEPKPRQKVVVKKKEKPKKEQLNICEWHVGLKVETHRSWHCIFKHHKEK
jgi:hypothetical protein